jgi:quinol monooxygenase YgiN
VPQPVGVIARFAPLPEKRSALQALLEGMVAPTRSEAGCRSYNLYEVPAGGDLLLIEGYNDQAALEPTARPSTTSTTAPN